MGLFTKLFGTPSQREIKKIRPLMEKVLSMEEEYRNLSDEELKGKTALFKARLAQGETLDDLLPEAFATAREAADRVLGMRPYPVQILGGIILHQGRIAEMKTGEGKTLVAVLPCYLNALSGKGVHVVTVNDYLARRDSEWMGKVHRYLGLSVGLIVPGLSGDQRRTAYNADITYCTNNELGFDYLRDNMALYREHLVQRGHNFAIVDEVDSILIDEARTPLIISGQGEESSDLYARADQLVASFRVKVFAKTEAKESLDDLDCDYYVDEQSRTVGLTASGIAKAERFFGLENLSDVENTTISHHINQAMKARGLMKRDTDYVLKDGQVIIVDQFTGRLMYGRRYNEGLHQAIEAKEKVHIAEESKTLATITFQNYFRLYSKLSGMTGTALTEQEEFEGIYMLDVVEIPTNREVIRTDHDDRVYLSAAAKHRAIVEQVKECYAKGQPVLVGTVSIDMSEYLSRLLKQEGIPHHVLNAKFHEQEAQIVAQAGKLGAVTIATNMAGRGTDIMLGGNPEFMALTELRRKEYPEELIAEATSHADTSDADVMAIRQEFLVLFTEYSRQTKAEAERVKAAGGLFIIGTERHESRRIDNQLRGRSGRQGDPGDSRFYLSLEDDLIRLFAGNRLDTVKTMLLSAKWPEGDPIEMKMLSGLVENAQKTVESNHFRSRKHVLEYDNVLNTQREVIYGQRKKVLNGEDLRQSMLNMLREVIESTVSDALGQSGNLTPEALSVIRSALENVFIPAGIPIPEDLSAQELTDLLYDQALKIYEAKEVLLTPERMRELERTTMLRVVDEYWMDNIEAMDELKQGITLRAYGQHDPVIAYKEEGYELFQAMVTAIREETIRRIFLVQLRPTQTITRKAVARVTGTSAGSQEKPKQQPIRVTAKPKRNDKCPCGSGKKYKQCCYLREKQEN